jgi:cytoskeletal protein CcmA (bactofilin family)
MFSKNAEKLESIIGGATFFKGEIKSNGTLRIDGRVEGNVEADSIIIGEKGNIKGNMEAKNIVVGGHIEGNLNAKAAVEIKQKGKVSGDIMTSRLTVMEGGIINGRTNMHPPETKVVELSKEMVK